MSGEIFPRTPSVPRLVGEVRPDDDRVRVVGTVTSVEGPTEFSLQDPTGTIAVTVADPSILKEVGQVRENMILRVHGQVEVSMDGGPKIVAEIVQDFSNIDITLYQKVHEIVHF